MKTCLPLTYSDVVWLVPAMFKPWSPRVPPESPLNRARFGLASLEIHANHHRFLCKVLNKSSPPLGNRTEVSLKVLRLLPSESPLRGLFLGLILPDGSPAAERKSVKAVRTSVRDLWRHSDVTAPWKAVMVLWAIDDVIQVFPSALRTAAAAGALTMIWKRGL